MNQKLEYKRTSTFLLFSTLRSAQGSYDGMPWGSERYPNENDVQFIEPTTIPAAMVSVDDVYADLCKKVLKKEEAITNEAKECCYKLSHAFENQNIREFAVDYGKKYKAISLDIVVNDEIEFLARTEIESPSKCVSFSIIKEGEVIYMNNDTLDDFKNNIDNYFIKLGATPMHNKQRLNPYSQYSFLDVKDNDMTAGVSEPQAVYASKNIKTAYREDIPQRDIAAAAFYQFI